LEVKREWAIGVTSTPEVLNVQWNWTLGGSAAISHRTVTVSCLMAPINSSVFELHVGTTGTEWGKKFNTLHIYRKTFLLQPKSQTVPEA
jgi:hypothetical protein